MKLQTTLTALSLVLAPALAAADDVMPEDQRERVLGEVKKEDMGWKVTANFGGTGSINHSSNFVGTDDGLTLQVGIVLGGDAVYKDEHNDFFCSQGLVWPPTLTTE